MMRRVFAEIIPGIVLGWLLLGLPASPVHAQTPPPDGGLVEPMPEPPLPTESLPSRYSPVSRTDAYGNASPNYLQRRALSVYQNREQERILRGYLLYGRRQYRRGGEYPFSFPSDVLFREGRRAPSTLLPAPFGRAFGTQSPSPAQARREAIRQFGGFEERSGLGEGADITTTLRRKQLLLMGAGLNAPVHRALMREGGAIPTVSSTSVERTPFIPSADDTVTDKGASLTDALHEGVEAATDRIRRRAWEQFTAGQYRQAARSFETLSEVNADDVAARVGEMFSHLSLGVARTAIVVFQQLLRRDPAPFAYDLRVDRAYGDAREAMRVRLRTRSIAGAAAENRDIRAMYIVLLWYLGDREEAMTLATQLAREHPGTPYADWPARMREARSGEDGPTTGD